MLRLRLLQKTGRRAGLAHYLAARQQQRRALQASTPVRFLQKLGLVRQPATTRLRRNWSAAVWPEHWMVDAGNPIGEETLGLPIVAEVLVEESSEVREQRLAGRGALMVERSERLGQKKSPPSPTSVPEITAKTNPTEIDHTEAGIGLDRGYLGSSELAPKGEEATTSERSTIDQFMEKVELETEDEVIAALKLLPSAQILPTDPVPASQNESNPLMETARDELSLLFSAQRSQEEALLRTSDNVYSAVNENQEEVAESTSQQDFVKDSETLSPFASHLSQPTGKSEETEAAFSLPNPPPAVGKRRQRATIEEVSPTSIATALLTNVKPASPKPDLSETASTMAAEETEVQSNVAPYRPVSSFAQKPVATAAGDESAERDNRTPAYWHARLVAAAAREQQQTTAVQSANRTHLQASSAKVGKLPARASTQSTTTRALSSQETKGQPMVIPANVPQSALPRQFIRPQSLGKAETAEPLSSATRRFLTPLLGFDPATVPLYHDEAATHWTRGYQADALTDGEAIAIRSDYKSDAPEFLGVLAHELTHLVRRQQPRFVPPIARAGTSKTNTFVAPELMDEEQIAHRVESRVRQAAQSVASPRESPRSEQASAPTRRGTEESATSRMPGFTLSENWGGLPAPWEPMPEMIAPISAGIHVPFSQPQMKSAGTEPVGIRSAPVSTAFSPAPVAVAGAAPAPIQLAEEGRSLEEEVPSGVPAEGQQQVQPDLDDLARQVYSVLKRRLAAERRREYLV